MGLLEKIKDVRDLRKLGHADLPVLAAEVRERIIDVISKNGGHLASSLGVVELTIALHSVFSTPRDKIIWDVGHQSYAHKILTGRNDAFDTIRKPGGLSGFPKRSESEFDAYNTGHSSTSLSLAMGTAVARDIKKERFNVVAVIGDGSMTGGMAFEALNHIGHNRNNLIIILNDNEHSISRNVGALSEYLTRMISGSAYNKFRRKSMKAIRRIPLIGASIFNFLFRAFAGFKGLLVPGQLFQDMGVRYFGPVDGHNVPLLMEVLQNVKSIDNGPRIVHVITKKGKGYLPAELNPAKFHGIGSFDRATGQVNAGGGFLGYSDIAGRALAELAAEDKKIIAVTAAMKLGTGLYEFEKKCPRRLFDVGIAEQHAVTFAGAMASGGLKPFISIYSTFMQRAVDQIIHDVALMNLPVKLLIDRAGIVGDDGETHHGLYDISILKNIPNFILLAPSNAQELRDMLKFAADYDDGPVAIRYPRGRVPEADNHPGQFGKFSPGKMRIVNSGQDAVIFTFGDMIKKASSVSEMLKAEGISVAVVNLLSLKPLDMKGIIKIIEKVKCAVTMENGVKTGGIGETILSLLPLHLRAKMIHSAGFPSELIPHGDMECLFAAYGLDPASIASIIKKYLQKK